MRYLNFYILFVAVLLDFVFPLNLTDCSLAIPILPIAIGAGSALMAGANLLLGNKQVEAQKDANKLNQSLTRETNELNYQMWQEQNAENWKMFNATNEYNSPAAIRARYEQAGINPALAMANQGAIAAQSLNQPSSAPAVAPKMDAVDYSPYQSAINSSISSFWDSLMSMQQFQSNNIDLAYKGEDWRVRIDKMIDDTLTSLDNRKTSKLRRNVLLENLNYLKSVREYQRSQEQFNALQMQLGVHKVREEILSMRANTDAQLFQNQLNKDLRGITIAQAAANLDIAYKTIANLEITGDKTRVEIRNILADTNLKWLQGNNIKVQTEGLQKEQTETFSPEGYSHRLSMRKKAEEMADQQIKMYDLNIGRELRHEDMPILYDNPLMNLFKGFVIK